MKVQFTLTSKTCAANTLGAQGENFEDALLHLMIQFKIQVGNFDCFFLELLPAFAREFEFAKECEAREGFSLPDYNSKEWNSFYEISMKVS